MLKRSIFFIFLTFCLSSFVYSGGFQLNEHGAKAMAQAGAFAARADDPSAMYFNPAGISFLKGTNVYLGVTMIAPSMTFRGPSNLNENNETKMDSKIFTPINFYVTQEINDMFSVGFGVNNPFGLGTKWPDQWVGKALATKSEVQIFNFNPVVSVKLFDGMIAIAAGFDYSIGSVEIIRDYPIFSPSSQVTLKGGLTDGKGSGFNGGILCKPTDNLSLGFSYRSKIKFDLNGTATFTPNRDVFPAGDASATLNLPSNMFIGIAYSPMKDLWLEFDAQLVGWSTYDKLEITFKKDNSVSSIAKNYKNSSILRFGGEYQLNDQVALRAGYLHDFSPAPDETLDPLLPDADRNGYNIGVGYKLTNKINIDVAYFFLPFNQRTTNTQQQGFNGTYNTITNLFAVDLAFNF